MPSTRGMRRSVIRRSKLRRGSCADRLLRRRPPGPRVCAVELQRLGEELPHALFVVRDQDARHRLGQLRAERRCGTPRRLRRGCAAVIVPPCSCDDALRHGEPEPGATRPGACRRARRSAARRPAARRRRSRAPRTRAGRCVGDDRDLEPRPARRRPAARCAARWSAPGACAAASSARCGGAAASSTAMRSGSHRVGARRAARAAGRPAARSIWPERTKSSRSVGKASSRTASPHHAPRLAPRASLPAQRFGQQLRMPFSDASGLRISCAITAAISPSAASRPCCSSRRASCSRWRVEQSRRWRRRGRSARPAARSTTCAGPGPASGWRAAAGIRR